jgi:hypothetical protein
MISSTLKICAPVVLMASALVGCSNQGGDTGHTAPPAPVSSAAAPSPAMPPAPAQTAPSPAPSSPAPATTTH